MQFSLFGAAAAAPTREDLDGIVLAGGQWVRAQPDHALLSILVDRRWRSAALAAELALRDEPAELVEVGDAGEFSGLISVRTALRRELLPAAQRWTRGARLVPPADLALTAGGLRLWAIATGRRDDSGYLLGTPSVDSSVHRAAGAQLAALGLAAVGVAAHRPPDATGDHRAQRGAKPVDNTTAEHRAQRGAKPVDNTRAEHRSDDVARSATRGGWRLTGIKRIRRFAELLGEPPVGAGVDWPTSMR